MNVKIECRLPAHWAIAHRQSARLVALFGEARVAHMILTTELLSANQALASGFVHDVLEDRVTAGTS